MNATDARSVRRPTWLEAALPLQGVLPSAIAIVAGSLAVAAMAQLRVLLPFSPVPITGQTLAVLLVGTALGPWRGGLSLGLYLAEGAVGLPVFAGGAAGLATLAGPTGGYLVGFVVAAVLTGHLAQRGWDRRWLGAATVMVLGNVVIYALGVAWLTRFVGWPAAWLQGVAPFLAGDAIKLALATGLLPSAWALLDRLRLPSDRG